MKTILHVIWKYIRNKYSFAVFFFLIWIFFFDEHNLLQHFQNKQKLSLLVEQKDFLETKIESDQRKIQELQTNQKNLEKFAREQFLMKKSNEDVFVIIEEE